MGSRRNFRNDVGGTWLAPDLFRTAETVPASPVAGRGAVTRLFSPSSVDALLCGLITGFLLFLAAALPLQSREKDKVDYGMGLIVNIPLPEAEVVQVVQEVVQSGIIRGSKEYNKDEYITGAVAVASSSVFPAWTEGGQVFYKVRKQALDPRNFKDGGDVGTLAVRYVVHGQGDKNTVVRIDALYEEDFRRTVHQSNGSVETAEYKDIREHLDAIETMKQETLEAQRERQEQVERKQRLGVNGANPSANSSPPVSSSRESQAGPTPQPVMENRVEVTTPEPSTSQLSASAPAQTLEQRVQDLRRQVERLVKAPGAPLKSAPFHTASTLKSLSTGTEVLIVISTPYWFGVETHDGQHGWIPRDQLELLP